MQLARPVPDGPAGVASVEVDVVSDGVLTRKTDVVTMEEPLEIRLLFGPDGQREERNLAVTMCTPGDDAALALGFLHGEGVVRGQGDVVSVEQVVGTGEDAGNVVRVELAPSVDVDTDRLTRNFYTTSSCGVCGKASLDAVRVQVPDRGGRDAFNIDERALRALPERLSGEQEAFAQTGGLHASGAFDADGRIVAIAEDVGRHNALDKLVGGFLSNGRLPMAELGVIFSGRASFELIQKAAMAGCPFVVAIGPPSSLAIELAAEQRMTLVGFLREHRFNIYTLPHRVRVEG